MPRAKLKPLSFTTTLRNPDRIAAFLKVLAEVENRILTKDIAFGVAKRLIAEKLYTPLYVGRNSRLKEINNSDDANFADKDVNEIFDNSPQNHKEAGFDKGWASRFDTWYKFPMELGFCFYEMGKPILLSNTGHMLIDAYNEETPNGDKIQAVFLNAFIKYQTNNPFRKILNENAPLVLLLQVIKLLKDDNDENGAGIARRELPLIICSPDNDAQKIYSIIKDLRSKYGFNYSDDIIYDICFDMLGGIRGKDEKYLKKDKITKEAVDDFLRKVRITGIVSLRGAGRFVDFNTFEQAKIDYILENYIAYEKHETREDYFKYMGQIDSHILEFEQAPINKVENVRQTALVSWANHYSKADIDRELKVLSGKGRSNDEILKEINEPTRFEFLTAIALKQSYPTIEVHPNYKVDDEGFPTFTASGGMSDIVCYDNESRSLFEVTLMRGKVQATNEIPAITRHILDEQIKEPNKIVFSVFIAPNIHFNTKYMIEFSKYRDKVDIIPLTIGDFVSKRNKHIKISEYLEN